VDTTKAGFDAEKAIKMAKSQGANVMFLALSKDSTRVDQALALARANSEGSSPLLLLGGNELYNPDILIKGGDSVSGLVLAVPWSFQPTDPFARDAIKSWKGRVSWRTATAYDATKMLTQTLEKNPDRQDTNQAFQQGVPLSGNATNFNVFTDVPLVKAIPGTSGPAGSKYQFEPLR
jgi:ABC-type branched-subunit amino acid transport system substrate-binding protein